MRESGTQIFKNLRIIGREGLPSKYPHLPGVIAKRDNPGILILTPSNDLVFINTEARKALKSLDISGETLMEYPVVQPSVPQAATYVCNKLKSLVSSLKTDGSPGKQSLYPSVFTLSTSGSEPYSFRAFLLSNSMPGTMEGAYILVLIERVSSTRRVNINKAVKRYRLSKREIEVIDLLVMGQKNKEIADKLCVCVYTIEDHMKKIMKKMQVKNRTSIFAKLLD